jgi:hypothetical protein
MNDKKEPSIVELNAGVTVINKSDTLARATDTIASNAKEKEDLFDSFYSVSAGSDGKTRPAPIRPPFEVPVLRRQVQMLP